MAYHHIDVECQQVARRSGDPCGDAFMCQRTTYHTTLICADGVGSGVKAHIAAEMNMARLAELLRGGMSLRDAFFSVVSTMDRWRDGSMPFTAFSVARILNDGATTVLAYEMPPPVFFGLDEVHVLEARALVVDAGVANEYRCHLSLGDGLVLLSDGMTQSGFGGAHPSGWGAEGVAVFLRGWAGRVRSLRSLACDLMRQAMAYDGQQSGDDRTVVMAQCRPGRVVDILTGPPSDRGSDMKVVNDFLDVEGCKVVCGATTADVVARCAQVPLEVEQNPVSLSTPPRYFIEGIDLVTEGVVTLNQVHHLLDENLEGASDESAAVDLARMLSSADRVNMIIGEASNPANADLVYRKQGILSRRKIMGLIAGKLERAGKLVSIQYC